MASRHPCAKEAAEVLSCDGRRRLDVDEGDIYIQDQVRVELLGGSGM